MGDTPSQAPKSVHFLSLLKLLFNLALGLLSRLMPQLQVFFVGLPVQILAGFILMAAGLAFAMTWFLGQLANAWPGLL